MKDRSGYLLGALALGSCSALEGGSYIKEANDREEQGLSRGNSEVYGYIGIILGVVFLWAGLRAYFSKDDSDQ